MKNYKYFKNVEDVVAFYGAIDKIPSKDLIIVGDNEAMFTSSNNFTDEGLSSDQGGYVESPEEKAEYAYATTLSSYTLVGESVSEIINISESN